MSDLNPPSLLDNASPCPDHMDYIEQVVTQRVSSVTSIIDHT